MRVAICAPYLQLPVLVEAFRGTGIGVGAQNVHDQAEGAFTGEISIPMLEEIGVDYCIVGHSERRQYFNESDDTVNRKVKALLKTSIIPIVCVGEDLQQKEAGYEKQLVSEQVKNALHDIPADKAERIVIAYEPIWAIGTGRTATPIQANMMCELIRDTLTEMYGDEVSDRMIIQYGGSVKPENASEIMNMEEIDGAKSDEGGCNIATCVYGSYDCPEVWVLRRFRDYKLKESWCGRCFIRIYYSISPTIVRWFGTTKWFNHIWKARLDNIVKRLKEKGYHDTHYHDKF